MAIIKRLSDFLVSSLILIALIPVLLISFFLKKDFEAFMREWVLSITSSTDPSIKI